MEEKNRAKETFSIDKEKDFSNWYTEIVKRAELADLRYNVKGFLVFQPWSVLCMEEMYKVLERVLQKKGHKPYFYPALIPEKNFFLEKEHVEGFAPEVFWVTEHGEQKFEEKLALRPTSETAFYQMFSLWIRSYKDMPFKTYQRAQVWRYETKATRPFLRSREFYWIESHCAFASLQDAEKQVKEDMETTEEVMHQVFGIPFIFFKRPEWDKFSGAVHTYAADTITPIGKVVQQPSTHLLGENFSKPFNVKFADKDGEEKYAFITCYGPAVSRIFASLIITHGDSKGLRFPFEIAPKQIVIVPVAFEKDSKVLKKAEELKEKLECSGYRTELDSSDSTAGEKFYFWEMKGVPFRIEIGPKELKEKSLQIYRRDSGKKEKVSESSLLKWIEKYSKEYSKNLKHQADEKFHGFIKDANSKEEVSSIIEGNSIVRCGFCSVSRDGEKCAEEVEKDFGARVRGTRVDKKEFPKGNCIICGKQAKNVVYIAREY